MREFDLGAVTAYALAVKNGFQGTEQEWLASLVPELSIGEVKTLQAGSNAAAAIGGTPEKPVLNLSLPRGENGYAADWNQNDPAQPDYVKNRTHYEDENGVIVPLPAKYLPDGVPYVEEGGMVEILPETTVTFDEDGVGMVEGMISLTVDENYTVKWNGREYVCAAQDASAGVGPGAVFLGNGTGLGLVGNGEPFIVATMPGEGMAAIALDGSSEVVVSIYWYGAAIQKLDNRCLDLEWLPVNNYEPLVEEKTLVVDYTNPAGQSLAGIDLVPLVDGQRVRVDFDGAQYDLTAVADGNGAFLVGNGAIVNFGPDTGEPFALVFNAVQKLAVAYTLKQGVYAFAMYTLKANRMPAEFLPADATELYLTSSGGKKFKITVSDEGVLSAAEVTE